MKEVIVKDADLRDASEQGMDAFLSVLTDAILKSIGGELNADTMPEINADQITLLAYVNLRDEVMNGGFIQLIHNGYGGFIFRNPFSKVMKLWGLDDLHRLINKVHKLYSKYHEEIEADCTDDEFMALFEKMPEFDDFDDEFIENEEQWTAMIAYYVDEHLDRFVTVAES